MPEDDLPGSGLESESASAPPPAPEPPRLGVFIGPNGIRAGWRLFIALAIFAALLFVIGAVIGLIEQGSPRIFRGITAIAVLTSEAITFVIYLITSWIMSRIEGRRMRDYGLGPSGAFGAGFWLAAMIGFAAISVLLFALKIAGAYHLGTQTLHGAGIEKYAVLWALALLTVGFLEESCFRGYALFTLSTGLTFWPAAILTSLAFGAIHLGNTGESHVGVLSACGTGFFFCILIRKTGNLWPAIGFHAAWDWGETFFYGVPDSGLAAPGHLFSARLSGPVWLAGGTVGPEASWFCLILIVLLCIGAAFLPGAKFPNPDAVPDPRRHHAAPAPTLFPEADGQI